MIFRILIILFLILCTTYDLVLKIVQYRSEGNPTPANMADVYGIPRPTKSESVTVLKSVGWSLSKPLVCLCAVCSCCVPMYMLPLPD